MPPVAPERSASTPSRCPQPAARATDFALCFVLLSVEPTARAQKGIRGAGIQLAGRLALRVPVGAHAVSGRDGTESAPTRRSTASCT